MGKVYNKSMDIEDFVKQVLAQITASVNKNDTADGIKYTVDYNSGVDFDLAVTTMNVTSTDKGKNAGLRVSVVGADVSKKSSAQVSHQVTSRVKFNVNVRRERNG
jgi:hypothetical protein